ncbi:MAG: bifunctional riboflavin kinase/FAD synthetase, partial [Betaproteobacteria bacterium]
MRIHRGLPSAAVNPVALTIGNFDGVHRGHQAMLSRLVEAAEDLRLPPAVLTFDPHPREFFAR